MIISQIVAVSINGVIGIHNGLPWQMPDDMAYFKEKTLGHHIVMGRRNYEAECKALPGRVNIVLTRNPNYQIPDGIVVHQIEDAIELARKAGEKELFIVGGAEIYKLAMPFTHRIYLTRIHTELEGDTFYPVIDEKIWKEVSRISHKKDARNPFDYDFLVYKKIAVLPDSCLAGRCNPEVNRLEFAILLFVVCKSNAFKFGIANPEQPSPLIGVHTNTTNANFAHAKIQPSPTQPVF